MDNGLIPHRYAKALYKFAQERGDTEKLYDLTNHVIEEFRKNPSMQKVLANPFISIEDKKNLLTTAAGKHVSEDFKRFIDLILEHKRVDYAYEMMLAYRDIYRKANNISMVKITTATKLKESQMQKLKELVSKGFKGRKFEFSEDIDPELIGGFIIDVDSVRMDASISNELEQLRQTLLSK